ncbi:hypothetical protein Cali_108 [Mycobacterium phage Cali]|uniref:Uncharacterized protein n=33 Tax=Bixzunavirus TaxID=680114 RepID=G1BT07_9CAUD|nr:gp108 [Mycobacterium phage Cali]YP_003347780.1 hypothetical protein ET08_101 [Mycobacterium phage ET08]YP_008060911.1 hypothetical protein M181_gp216 [Mycobacterium phage Gizmo]YP_010057749.1 hypothetical protein KHO61_gp209 [Mycobacterium phage Mangeria]YP_010058202.1 hypothetical protein KHO63_gp200 [Mycobacterium phage QBert]ACU41630.1 hypothetical protein LRRHOOD_106 [Mycobacterium phage LRRHood]AEK07025.1 hypothetical protein DRAZDYS_111 [Mycobacterium phage Drazdys]AER25475.1 hypoth
MFLCERDHITERNDPPPGAVVRSVRHSHNHPGGIMNPKAQMMSATGYVKRPNKATRAKEARAWKRDQEISRYR